MDFNDPNLYAGYRSIIHECGHATVAWLSPAVAFVDRITLDPVGGAKTEIGCCPANAEYHLGRMVGSMAGMAAEIIVWKKVRAVGFQNDLANAWTAAEIVGQNSPPDAVARRWKSFLSDT